MTISRSTTSNYNKTSLTLPDPPTSLVATGGSAQASIAFTSGSNGGSPITSYTMTSNPGNISQSGANSPIVVTGLTNGTSYTFTGIASTTIGDSAISSPSNAVVPATSFSLEYLVVAGGGSGGYGSVQGGSGGGGGGGHLSGNLSVSPGTNYTVTVGAGGSNSNGSNSVFSSITSQGGGKGGNYDAGTGTVGNNGGSGGGGGSGAFTNGAFIAGGTGNSSPQQGYGGGNAVTSGSTPTGGGGGGALGIGGDAQLNAFAGDGSFGEINGITGTNIMRAGGGGGSAWDAVPNGTGYGGGGNGSKTTGAAGTVNRGGGGGAGGTPGNGGSGLVVLKVPNPFTANVANTLTFNTSNTVSGFTIYAFTAGTGNITF